MNVLLFLAGVVVGSGAGYLARDLVSEARRDRRSVERQRKRAILGLPDRPPRRTDAQGSARVLRADYRTRNWTRHL